MLLWLLLNSLLSSLDPSKFAHMLHWLYDSDSLRGVELCVIDFWVLLSFLLDSIRKMHLSLGAGEIPAPTIR